MSLIEKHEKTISRREKAINMWQQLSRLSASFFSIEELRFLMWEPREDISDENFKMLSNMYNFFVSQGKIT